MRKEYQRKTANMQDSSTTLLEHVLQSVFFASGSIFESKFAKPIAVLLLLNIFYCFDNVLIITVVGAWAIEDPSFHWLQISCEFGFDCN